MPKFDFGGAYQQANKQYNLEKGQYFRLKEGANRVRLVSECLPHEGSYKGTRNFKWLCQVIDRTDGQVKPFFMPNTIYKAIAALQMSEDYAFQEVPMPYDITINAVGAGTKEVVYSVVPARQSVPLTPEEEQSLAKSATVNELQMKLREKEAVAAFGSEAPARKTQAEDVDISKINF